MLRSLVLNISFSFKNLLNHFFVVYKYITYICLVFIHEDMFLIMFYLCSHLVFHSLLPKIVIVMNFDQSPQVHIKSPESLVNSVLFSSQPGS